MRQDISEYYRSKGYSSVYVAVNGEPRRVATIRKADGTMTSMSYAKYLYTSHYCCDIPHGEEIDHINGDKMDDALDNLQKVSVRYNRQKDHQRKEMVERTCPVCGVRFLFEKRNLSTHPNPCCSRRCGGIKSRGGAVGSSPGS